MECTHPEIEELYLEWGQKGEQHWQDILDKLSAADRQQLLTPGKLNRLRGPTARSRRWGGWLHELGDISPVQYQILAAAYPGEALDYIFKAQKALTHHNTAILMKYAKLIGMNKGPDNGIRITVKLAPTQEQLAQIKQNTQSSPSTLPDKQLTTPPPCAQHRHRTHYDPLQAELCRFADIQKVWKQCGHSLSPENQIYYGQLKASQHQAGSSSSCSGAPRPQHIYSAPPNAVLPPLYSPFLAQFGSKAPLLDANLSPTPAGQLASPSQQTGKSGRCQMARRLNRFLPLVRGSPPPPPTPSPPTLLTPLASRLAQHPLLSSMAQECANSPPSPPLPASLNLSPPGGVCAPTHTFPASSQGQRSWEGRTQIKQNLHIKVATENNGDATPPLSASYDYQIGELQY